MALQLVSSGVRTRQELAGDLPTDRRAVTKAGALLVFMRPSLTASVRQLQDMNLRLLPIWPMHIQLPALFLLGGNDIEQGQSATDSFGHRSCPGTCLQIVNQLLGFERHCEIQSHLFVFGCHHVCYQSILQTPLPQQ